MKEQEMITKRYKFSVGTKYVGSYIEDDEIEIGFTKEDYENGDKREDIINEYYEEWVWENIDCDWREIE
ncbi:predicted protein [Clostridium botulinum B str. Osaka05]|uniref:DUF7167 domain-containing protein n=1 Tax=Clostridium botulinum B str. Osaka05 TaxID=1407017 RepID=A0A060N9E5_CLOBO|nr:hypothetical protein [Clostridium botulinum]BAO04784.1 predicted protein [Clostridium botulinum B str. Osaka05]